MALPIVYRQEHPIIKAGGSLDFHFQAVLSLTHDLGVQRTVLGQGVGKISGCGAVDPDFHLGRSLGIGADVEVSDAGCFKKGFLKSSRCVT